MDNKKTKNLLALLIVLITIWSTYGVAMSRRISHNLLLDAESDDCYDRYMWMYDYQDPFREIELQVGATGFCIFVWYLVTFYDVT